MKLAIAAAVVVAFSFSCAGAPSPKAPEEPAAPVAAAPAAPTAPAQPAQPAPAPAKQPPRIVVVRIPMEVKASVFFADGALDGYTVSERNADGALLAQIRHTASGTPVERIDISYADGKIQSREIRDAEGKLTSKRTFSYGSDGVLIGETLEDAAGKRLSSFAYSYDANGKRVSWIVRDSKNSPVAETTYSYRDGKIQNAELKDGSGRKTGSSRYDYDGDRLAKQSFYDAGGSLLRVEESTWTNGKLVLEERKSAGGVVQQRTTYEYGPDGELLRKTLEDVAGKSKLTTTYEYAFKEERRTIE